jgi:hypothetical protein
MHGGLTVVGTRSDPHAIHFGDTKGTYSLCVPVSLDLELMMCYRGVSSIKAVE